LIEDLLGCPEIERVILTCNIVEPDITVRQTARLSTIHNPKPKGFGANHNAAFHDVRTPYLAILNPDIRLQGNPFPALLACVENEVAALCAPAVVNPAGALDDSARQFPSLGDLVLKALGRYEGRLPYQVGDSPQAAPWVGGMFMLIRREDYVALGGFDEGFFLYYEDVDLCARIWRSGRRVVLCPEVQVVHDARRASRRDFRHLRWHLASAARYFRKHGFRPGLPVS